MSFRPSRGFGLAIALSIVAIMIVWAPMMALADSGNSSAPAEPPGKSDQAPGNSAEPPGNSAEAPGQIAKSETTTTGTEAPPGNSATAPGQTKTDNPPAPPAGSNGGGDAGNSTSSGGNPDKSTPSTSNKGGNGNNVPADNLNDGVGGGVGNSENQDKDRPKVGNGEGKGQIPADDCTNKHQGADGNKGGANQNPGPYDNTCDGRPSENGQGGGNAKGRPCQGCVGNADDKNPPGQFPNGASDGNKGNGKGNGKNRGYECDDNNGVGKGNPAHTGCAPGGGGSDPEYDCAGHLLPNDHDESECEEKVWICHSTSSASNPWVVIEVSLNAWPAHATHGDKQVSAGTLPAACALVIVEYDCAGHELPNDHSSTECDDPPEFDCAGHELPNDHSSTECDDPPEFDCAGHLLPNDHSVDECDPPLVDCDNDGIDDNVDPDITSCEPPPEGEDCDGDGIPDDVDTDLSACDPDERPEFCPDGVTPLPEDGICDEVLGEIIDRDPKPGVPGGPLVAGEVLGKADPKGAVLPFTGGSVLPVLIVSLTMLGAGGATLYRRRDAGEDAAA